MRVALDRPGRTAKGAGGGSHSTARHPSSISQIVNRLSHDCLRRVAKDRRSKGARTLEWHLVADGSREGGRARGRGACARMLGRPTRRLTSVYTEGEQTVDEGLHIGAFGEIRR